MKKISLFLWFDGKALQAAKFYVSIFKRSSKNCRILDAGDQSVSFELEGQEYIAFNGGPMFKFSPAMSLFVSCKDQKEVDYYWDALSKGGKKGRCGWLTDKFGVTWQVIPKGLGDLLGGDDDEGAARAMQAMLKMKKLEIAKLKRAYEGK